MDERTDGRTDGRASGITFRTNHEVLEPTGRFVSHARRGTCVVSSSEEVCVGVMHSLEFHLHSLHASLDRLFHVLKPHWATTTNMGARSKKTTTTPTRSPTTTIPSPTTMDYDGQRRSERDGQVIVTAVAVCAFVYGWMRKDYDGMLKLFWIGSVVACAWSVPAWSRYRRKPTRWAPAVGGGQRGAAKATQKRLKK